MRSFEVLLFASLSALVKIESSCDSQSIVLYRSFPQFEDLSEQLNRPECHFSIVRFSVIFWLSSCLFKISSFVFCDFFRSLELSSLAFCLVRFSFTPPFFEIFSTLSWFERQCDSTMLFEPISSKQSSLLLLRCDCLPARHAVQVL